MTEGKRPGGLTALAVINFVWGGFGVLGFLGLVLLMGVAGAVGEAVETAAEGEAEKQAISNVFQEMGSLFYLYLFLFGLSTFLLIASGVGYLKQKKLLGRTFGNSYALLAVAQSLWGAMGTSEEAGGGFTTWTMIGLVYPLLTLILLNTTFKEDFTR